MFLGAELDGFDGRPGVLLLAATNRPDVLDAALMRPGRLSRKVVVPLPDESARAAILGVHLRRVPLATQHDRDLACEAVAKITAGAWAGWEDGRRGSGGGAAGLPIPPWRAQQWQRSWRAVFLPGKGWGVHSCDLACEALAKITAGALADCCCVPHWI